MAAFAADGVAWRNRSKRLAETGVAATRRRRRKSGGVAAALAASGEAKALAAASPGEAGWQAISISGWRQYHGVFSGGRHRRHAAAKAKASAKSQWRISGSVSAKAHRLAGGGSGSSENGVAKAAAKMAAAGSIIAA